MVPQREASDLNKVSARLHTLRGEAFRHRRNILGTRAFAPASSSAQGPSLPPLAMDYPDPDDNMQDTSSAPSVPRVKAAGPSPPPSWIPSAPSSTLSATPQWRAHALSLILRHTPATSPALAVPTDPRIPSLFQLCLRKLLLDLEGIPSELFRHLPRHILREYVRYSAVHRANLPRTDLEALWSVDDAGSADGELIITDVSVAVLPRILTTSSPVAGEWDTPTSTADPEPPPALHTLVLLAPREMLFSVISAFPPTLTHLALLRVSSVPLHTLPDLLPLIKVLDLSFNDWIGRRPRLLMHVTWRWWIHLEVLGLRECGISAEYAKALEDKISIGRWTNVEIDFGEGR